MIILMGSSIFKKRWFSGKSGAVSTNSRHFARTYEDCIEIYNQLIRDKIEKLRKIADDLENELL